MNISDNDALVVEDVSKDFISNIQGKSPSVTSAIMKTIIGYYFSQIKAIADGDAEAHYMLLRLVGDSIVCEEVLRTGNFDLLDKGVDGGL